MIPNIFISSTILDLHHLRDSIRDTIEEIGYTPVMSEYGDIGYLPSTSAVESCYIALKDCQLAVFIIGKRYGSILENGLSVTHNEFKAARQKKIPVIFLVDEEVMSFRKVFESNRKNEEMTFPGMDHPAKTFALIREFADSEINNGLVTYTNVQTAKSQLKRQLAHVVGDLLRKSFDPIQSEMKDILTEITTLKHVLIKSKKGDANTFALAFRELLSKKNQDLKEIVEAVTGSLEIGVPKLITSQTFEQFLLDNQIKIVVIDTNNPDTFISMKSKMEEDGKKLRRTHYSAFSNEENIDSENILDFLDNEEPINKSILYAFGKNDFLTNPAGLKHLERLFKSYLNGINLPSHINLKE